MERTDSVDIDSHHEDVGTVDYAGSHEDDKGNSLQCTNKLCINCCSILKFDSATYTSILLLLRRFRVIVWQPQLYRTIGWLIVLDKLL